MPSYFLVAVSTRKNLEACVRHGLAGLPRSRPGVWAYEDILVGDYISFLYGAKVWNLYSVREKRAYLDATDLPPWELLTFRSGMRYDFAYRLLLEPVKALNEEIARPGFHYLGENLLQRGGYGKSHFQADQLTFNFVSGLEGSPHPGIQVLDLPPSSFEPRFARGRPARPALQLTELVLQSCLRQYLSVPTHGSDFLSEFGVHDAVGWEFLSEKALDAGIVDLFAKEAHPTTGRQKSLAVEVKLNDATAKDIKQALDYREELGEACVGAAVIAAGSGRKAIAVAQQSNVRVFSYGLPDPSKPMTFAEILSGLTLSRLV